MKKGNEIRQRVIKSMHKKSEPDLWTQRKTNELPHESDLTFCNYSYPFWHLNRTQCHVVSFTEELRSRKWNILIDLTITEVVSHQLPTKVDWAQSQFPLPILILPAASHSLVILSLTLHGLDTDSIIKWLETKKSACDLPQEEAMYFKYRSMIYFNIL